MLHGHSCLAGRQPWAEWIWGISEPPAQGSESPGSPGKGCWYPGDVGAPCSPWMDMNMELRIG